MWSVPILLAALVAASEARAAPEVAVSIRPLHALVGSVMAGVGEPELLLQGVISPHGIELRPSQAAALEAADLVVLVGAGLEPFAERWAVHEDAARLLRMSDLPAIRLLPIRSPGPVEDAAGAEREETHAVTDHPPAGSLDPHLWLDPANARVLVEAVAAALGELDRENRETYALNRDRMVAELGRLDDWIRAELRPLKDRPFVVAHDGYRYFTSRYGLAEAGVLAVDPSRIPGARTLRALRAELEAVAPACVFTEPGFPPSLVSTLTEGIEVEAGALDPLGGALPAGPGQYEALLRTLARSFADCLARLPEPR
ncbi:MAG TPA: zinc ABC transporter substrate-binding protein [Geminicoccaceae bacterium]